MDRQPDGLTFSSLRMDQAALVAGLPCRPRPIEEVIRLMGTATCFGLFDGTKLAGYTWASFADVTAPRAKVVLFELEDRGAYLFDMYVARAYRGRRFAPVLRQYVHQHLSSVGRDEMYSITLAYNRSSRRFKSRFGAVEVEKRLLLGLESRLLFDLRLKRLEDRPLPTPVRITVRARSSRPDAKVR